MFRAAVAGHAMPPRCSSTTKALGALALALTANALSVTNVFPYAPFQVKFFGLTEDDRELGFYAGFFMTGEKQ